MTRLISRFLVLVACGGSCLWFQPAAADDPPLAEPFLLEGRLDDGVDALTEHLKEQPQDDEARFGLGVIQFFQSVEHLAQTLYQHGSGVQDNSVAQMFPFLRLPVPPNPNPKETTIEDVRQMLQTMIDDLQQADQTLSQVEQGDVKLPLHVLAFRLDLNGDGQIGDPEQMFPIYERYLGGLAARQLRKDVVIAFDQADVHWLRGYCHLLQAMAESILAYDSRSLWDVAGHAVFPKAQNEFSFLRREAPEDPWSTDLILDAVAAIHAIDFPVRDAQRLRRAWEHLRVVTAQSRLSWDSIMNEMDDDREWIPSPTQRAAATPIRINGQMVATWREFLDEFDDLLEGRKLAPFWRGDDKDVGINLRKVFLEPTDFDLVMWIHGSGVRPFLEKGDVTDPETWGRFQRVFQGNFPGFALWFN